MYLIRGMNALALLAGMLATISVSYKIMLLGIIATNYVYTIHKHYYKVKKYSLRYSEKFAWQIAWEDQDFESITLAGSCISTTYMVILHFTDQNNNKHSVIIGKDSLSASDYRTLIVQLKISTIDAPV